MASASTHFANIVSGMVRQFFLLGSRMTPPVLPAFGRLVFLGLPESSQVSPASTHSNSFGSSISGARSSQRKEEVTGNHSPWLCR